MTLGQLGRGAGCSSGIRRDRLTSPQILGNPSVARLVDLIQKERQWDRSMPYQPHRGWPVFDTWSDRQTLP
jgi:hypothetical protein